MKVQNFKLRIVLLLVTGYWLLVTAPTTLASALSLSLDPPIIEIKAIAPTSTTHPLTIHNKSDNQVNLKIELKSFKAKGENGKLEYLKETSPIFNNIQIMDGGVPVEGITLEPKQQKQLDLNINIPLDTTISDYYFSIIFTSQNNSSPDSNSSIHQVGIATNILLSLGAKEIPGAVLEEFSTGLFFDKGPAPFTVRVKNKGNHLLKPKGEIIIKNMFGQSVGKIDLASVNVLSGSIRAVPAIWKESFLLGFYTATLNLFISDEIPPFSRQINFFAFPLQLSILVVASIIAAIITVNRVRKYMNKNRTQV